MPGKPRLRNHIFSETEKQIFYGSILGDGCLFQQTQTKNYSYSEKHSLKQEAYLRWKYSQLQEHVTDRGIKKDSSYHKAMDKTYESVLFYTNSNTEIEQIISQFYAPHKRIT